MAENCELVNTYEVLEHVMGIKGLHPHRLDTIREMREKLVRHISNNKSLAKGVVLDIGCGSGAGTRELAAMLDDGQQVIGVDISNHAITNARRSYDSLPNLDFYHGDLVSLLAERPDLRVSAVICISVSMFINDVNEFYRAIYKLLLEGGLFIDAPFMFRGGNDSVSEAFRFRTYAVCGCNMKMFQLNQLKSIFRDAGFSKIECVEHDFDLMKMPVLFRDYPAAYLFRNFLRNIVSPPSHFGSISSRYLLLRTLKIFIFFLLNRDQYASGEFLVVK